MSNFVPKTKEEVLASYGTVKKSKCGSRWYFSNDYGTAMSGTYYRQQSTVTMLNNVEQRMWRMVQRLKYLTKSYVAWT